MKKLKVSSFFLFSSVQRESVWKCVVRYDFKAYFLKQRFFNIWRVFFVNIVEILGMFTNDVLNFKWWGLKIQMFWRMSFVYDQIRQFRYLIKDLSTFLSHQPIYDWNSFTKTQKIIEITLKSSGLLYFFLCCSRAHLLFW